MNRTLPLKLSPLGKVGTNLQELARENLQVKIQDDLLAIVLEILRGKVPEDPRGMVQVNLLDPAVSLILGALHASHRQPIRAK